MPLINDYQTMTENMLDEYMVKEPSTQNPDDHEDWFTVGNYSLGIRIGNFNRVIEDLVNIGAITECDRTLDPDGTEENGMSYDENGFVNLTTEYQHVSYIVRDIDILRNKFIDVNEQIAGNQTVVNQMEENEIANQIVAEVGGFRAFANGSVLYDGEPIPCARQQKLLLKTLLENHGNTTTYEDIRTGIDRPDLSDTTINKYINRLKSETLIPVLGYNPITSETGIGQKLSINS